MGLGMGETGLSTKHRTKGVDVEVCGRTPCGEAQSGPSSGGEVRVGKMCWRRISETDPGLGDKGRGSGGGFRPSQWEGLWPVPWDPATPSDSESYWVIQTPC